MAMTMKGAPTGGEYEKAMPKAGARPARLVKIIDLGVHKREYQGKPKEPCRNIVLEFDLVNDLHVYDEEKGPQPIRVNTGYFYPLTVVFGQDGTPHEKSKLRKFIRALDPTNQYDYDLTKMLLLPCILNIEIAEKDGKQYANIDDVGPIPEIEGFNVAETEAIPYFFDLEDFTKEEWEVLPDFIKEICEKAENYVAK